MTTNVFVGTFVHSTWDDPMVIMKQTAVGVENDGKIVFICPRDQLDDTIDQYGVSAIQEITVLDDREFMIPGFVDTHIHAPQYVNAGKGLELSLLDWLNKYTYPTEAKFTDLEYARASYSKVVSRVLRNGTTTACYFATNDLQSSLELCKIIGKHGQRALVGKVCSNCNSPEYYVETTEDSLQDTETFIKDVISMKNKLVQPVVTPRFAASCDSQLLDGLSALKEKYDIPVQSHISENKKECEWIQQLYPTSANYADVYRKHNLLGRKTVMAHAVYLSDDEIQTFRDTETGVAHCPNSNMSLCSGLCDVRLLLENNVKVGLGTDVSGGYQASILDAIRNTVRTSNIVSLDRPDHYRRIDYQEAFRMATLGGAQVLNLDSKIGNFKQGKEFDAIRVNVQCPESPIDVFSDDTLVDMVQKFMFIGDDRNISDVYVSGRRVCHRDNMSETINGH